MNVERAKNSLQCRIMCHPCDMEDLGLKGKRRRSMTAVSQKLSIVLPLRAELWSGSPTKTRLPKPADVGVKDCCLYQKLDSAIIMMKSAEDRRRGQA